MSGKIYTAEEESSYILQSQTWKYALLVFLGGVSYGAVSPIAKTAYNYGFEWQQVTCGQSISGMVLFAIALSLQLAFFALRPQKARAEGVAGNGKAASNITSSSKFSSVLGALTAPGVLKLLAMGMVTCSTCMLYNIALSKLPVAVALTLLFQFTWIGVLMQIIITKRAPHIAEIVAAVIVVLGTFFASGLFSTELVIDYDPVGVLCGLGSAVSNAFFILLSSTVETKLPCVQRGLLVCCGSSIMGLIICPTFFSSGVLFHGLAPIAIGMGFTALLIPVILFALSTPYLPTGVSTILAATELPSGIIFTILLTGVGVDVLQTIGIVAILFGVFVSQLPTFQMTRINIFKS